MPLPISTDAVIEKNKITSNGAWIILLEILYEHEDPIRICLYSEEITWDGKVWLPAVFKLTGATETKDSEVPSMPFTITDESRNIIPILERYNGGVGAEVIKRIVHSKYLSNTTPESEERTEIIDVLISSNSEIQFKLGAENLQDRACPQGRFLKNQCRFSFKGVDGRCGYPGTELECNRTFARCKELNNSTRFGGFIGIGTIGVMI